MHVNTSAAMPQLVSSLLVQLGSLATQTPSPELHERYTVWSRVRDAAGGALCGDVVATAGLPGARLALVVVDFIGGGVVRAARARAFAAHLMAMLSLGATPATAMRVADAELRRAGWEDDLPPLVSAFVGYADRTTDTLTFVSAAHETALILAPDGTHRHLACTGPVAGLFETPEFEQAEVPLRRGESLVVVTDGIPDSHPPSGGFFGSTGTVRTAALALRAGDDPAEALIASAMRHGGGANDTAALIVRRE